MYRGRPRHLHTHPAPRPFAVIGNVSVAWQRLLSQMRLMTGHEHTIAQLDGTDSDR